MSKITLLRLEPKTKRILSNMGALAKYGALLDERDAAEQWHDSKLNRDAELVRRKHIAQDELSRLQNSEVKPDPEVVAAIKEELGEYEAKRTKLRAEPNPYDSLPENFNRTILRFGVNARFNPVSLKATLLKGESDKDGLIRFRKLATGLYTERKTTANAPGDKTEIKRRIAESVDKLAEEPVFSYVLTGEPALHHRGIEWPSHLVVANDMARELPNGAALLAAAFRDELVEKLTTMALAKHKGPGLSEVARRRALEQVDARLTEAERFEEDLVCRLKAAGERVHRDFRFSDDAAQNMRRVLIILGVERVHEVSEFG